MAFDGLIQADGLKTGDLIASWSEGEFKPRLAEVRYITGSEAGRLLAAPRDVELPQGEVPVLEGNATHTHLRLRPVAGGG